MESPTVLLILFILSILAAPNVPLDLLLENCETHAPVRSATTEEGRQDVQDEHDEQEMEISVIRLLSR